MLYIRELFFAVTVFPLRTTVLNSGLGEEPMRGKPTGSGTCRRKVFSASVRGLVFNDHKAEIEETFALPCGF